MLAPSVLQPRKSEVKHGVRHREQPRKQEARGNTQTATPPQAQAQQRQSPGKAVPPTRTTVPSMRQSPSVRRAPPARARPPSVPDPTSACQSPPAHARTPDARQDPSAPESPARAGAKTGRVRWRPCSGEPSPRRAPEPPTRRDENRAPERQPSRPSDFGVLIELSTKFPWHYPSRVPHSQSISRAEQRVPAAKNRQLCPAAVKIDDSSQPQGQNARLFALSGSPCANNRQNVRFPLPKPRKTVCFDRQRPKPTVFRIARPTRQPIPMPNKQHSRHRSR